MNDEKDTFDTELTLLSQYDANCLENDPPLDAVQFLPSLDDDGVLQLTAEEFFGDQPLAPTEATNSDSQTTANKESDHASISSEDLAPLTTQPAKFKLKKGRVSRKKQIEDLRETTKELMAELETLTKIGPRPRSFWEDIAARQLERRQQSEQENLKLREMLHIQAQEAKNLKRLLKRRTKIKMMEEMLGVKRQKVLQYSVPKDNPQVFAAMLQDIDELYVGTDALFATKGLYDLPCPGRRRYANRDISLGTFLELTQRNVVPFGLRETEKALWKTLSQVGFQNLKSVGDIAKKVHFHAFHVEELNNTTKMSFFAETTWQDRHLKGADFRSVARKYVESDRVVFICKTLVEPRLLDKRKNAGFQTRTTLRIVVREDSDGLAQNEGVSIIDSHFSATRYDEGLADDITIRTPTNRDIGIAAWDEAISRIAHRVENMAIDDCCSDKGSSAIAFAPNNTDRSLLDLHNAEKMLA
ncbi:hypothetical protein PHYBOEH_010553 [Phytophthora boehmeriae]|uniref:M96 mating-specific protein family n=1 Tax=Phytophthora boehmeriae TaxID=109152 RepID=A0A8T1VLW3_9STRA|nr:hypothetical protein PHYBOEH_010553 [Phytophthora boehmeriae]